MKLATILHISDLHFGDIDSATGDAVQPKLIGINRLIDGLLGHDLQSLKRVSKFWLDLKTSEPREVRTALVVTGDLTTVGKFDQYETANTYLSNQLDLSSQVPHLAPIGLSVADWRERGIPGNHDHYPGTFKPPKFMFGRAEKSMRDNFLKKYPTVSVLTLENGYTLKFLLINTDADVRKVGENRLYARGKFTSQLTKLSQLPEVNDYADKEIRVLCLHHSPAHQEFELGIDELSRGALNDFIVKYNVAVLLSGHKHTPPLIKIFPTKHLKISRKYLEARSGSTTQQSTLGFSTKTFTRRRPQRPDQMPNSFLVHSVYLENNKVYWKSNYYFEIPTGFKDQAYFSSSPEIRNLPADGPFKVYP